MMLLMSNDRTDLLRQQQRHRADKHVQQIPEQVTNNGE